MRLSDISWGHNFFQAGHVYVLEWLKYQLLVEPTFVSLCMIYLRMILTQNQTKIIKYFYLFNSFYLIVSIL